MCDGSGLPRALGELQRFFEPEQAAIGPMMEQVATGEPEITFWRKLETGDDVGWE